MGWSSVFQQAALKVAEETSQRPVITPRKIDWKHLVVCDFETTYDADYTLRKLSTSEYVRDARFYAQMMGLKLGTARRTVVPPKDIARTLSSIDWREHDLLCHNTSFDGFILSHHYSVKPRTYFDTLSMARGLHKNDIGASLDEVAQFYAVGNKIANVLAGAKGIRVLPPTLYKSMAAYCGMDVDLTLEIFKKMLPLMPADEMELIHRTVLMFCQPVLKVDVARVKAEHTKEVEHKKQLLLTCIGTKNEQVIETLKHGAEQALEQARKVIAGTQSFADLLIREGIEPPTKLSKTTGKVTYAFAKTDVEFTGLSEHRKKRVRDLVECRLSIKSSITETRAARFMEAGKGTFCLPVLLHYAGAHTYRWSAGNKMNMQNLTRGGELRKSILAPPGHMLVVGDSGQIEARINAWIAGQDDLLAEFREYDAGRDRDPYCKQADLLYNREITKADPTERFVGKVCVAGDTRVITNNGVKAIVDVTLEDLLWDGIEWVQHRGLLDQGTKLTIRMHGLAATPDHAVLTESGWQMWQSVTADPSLIQSALSSVSSPSFDGITTAHQTASRGVTDQCAAVRAAMSRWSTRQRSSLGEARDATHAQKSKLTRSVSGFTAMRCLMTRIADGCSTGFQQRSRAALTRTIKDSFTTVLAAFRSIKGGEMTVLPSFDTFRPSLAGINPNSKWTAPRPTATTSRATFASSRAKSTWATSGASPTSNNACAISKQSLPVFDLANAGPRHRFTVLTDAGPMIVHNCVLGLGFQMGAPKLQVTLALGTMGPPVFLELDECQHAVSVYRKKNHRIAAWWRFCQQTILPGMYTGQPGSWKCLHWEKEKIWLPNGMCLRYPNLRMHIDPDNEAFKQWTYTRKDLPVKIYGGLLCENITQALARIVIAGQWLQIPDRVVMMSHDELVLCVKKARAKKSYDRLMKTMSTSPSWAPDLPLTSEGGFDTFYSK